jgi:chemotaxis protein CheX
MNIQERMLNAISTSTEEVFTTMLGLQMGKAEVCIESVSPQVNDGLVSFIGLAGSWAGMGSISCSAALACRLCSQFLMTDKSAVDEEVLDALAELTNMIIGNVKTDLEHVLGPLGLSIPTVIFGKNFKARTSSHGDWSVIRYDLDGEALLIRAYLAPSQQSAGYAAPPIAIQSCTF